MTPIRRASAMDAPVLADLVHAASEGMAEVFWRSQAAEGEDPWDVGRRRQAEKAVKDEIWVIDEAGGPVAGLTGYAIGPEPGQPDDSTPPLIRPLIELEALAPSTWYVNVLAAMPECRGKGFGSELLGIAEDLARHTQRKGLSIIVSDSNAATSLVFISLSLSLS